MDGKIKLAEIADEIKHHLRLMEKDPKINPRDEHFWLHEPGAYEGGRFVYVSYVSFRGYDHLTKQQALTYLTAL